MIRWTFAALPLVGFASCATAPSPPPAPPAPPPPVCSPTDLRPQFAAFGLPPRSQGHRPTCSVFTTVAAFEFAAARATGRGERFSVEYLNWAANAATGRRDDGDFFHCALAGWDRFGICGDGQLPYAREFTGEAPPPDALVDAGRRLAVLAPRLQVRWIRPIGTGAGLTDAQFADVLRTLAGGDPVAAGAAHSRLLVGYRDDAAAPGGGVFTTLDSALGAFAEVDAAFVRTSIHDAFVVEAVLAATHSRP